MGSPSKAGSALAREELMYAWIERCRLYAVAQKLRDRAEKMQARHNAYAKYEVVETAKASCFYHEHVEMNDAKAHLACAEAKLLWVKAIYDTLGDVPVEWTDSGCLVDGHLYADTEVAHA